MKTKLHFVVLLAFLTGSCGDSGPTTPTPKPTPIPAPAPPEPTPIPLPTPKPIFCPGQLLCVEQNACCPVGYPIVCGKHCYASRKDARADCSAPKEKCESETGGTPSPTPTPRPPRPTPTPTPIPIPIPTPAPIFKCSLRVVGIATNNSTFATITWRAEYSMRGGVVFLESGGGFGNQNEILPAIPWGKAYTRIDIRTGSYRDRSVTGRIWAPPVCDEYAIANVK